MERSEFNRGADMVAVSVNRVPCALRRYYLPNQFKKYHVNSVNNVIKLSKCPNFTGVPFLPIPLLAQFSSLFNQSFKKSLLTLPI